MFRISRLQALINHLPRGCFDEAVAATGADKHRKGFSCWSQLVTMIYAQLSGADSLRTVVAGLNAHASHHYHLGVRPVSRSTLADANAGTDAAVFARIAATLMSRVQRQTRQQASELLYLLDSTSITLKGRGFDEWTFEDRTRCTQGLKLHVLYQGQEQVPCQISFSAANVNDIDQARPLALQSGARYVFDKGYCDYAWWNTIREAGAHFVTRFKTNAALCIQHSRRIPEAAQATILEDQIVRFKYRHNRAGHTNPYQAPLRRIIVDRGPDQKPLLLATNDLKSPALEIASHYRARWGIELFFKWIKQHLQLGRFLGRSENAVKIQILTALIAYLLVALYRLTHATTQSMWACLALLRASLFQRPAIETYQRAAHRRRRQNSAMYAQQQVLFT
jgi:putative transposase